MAEGLENIYRGLSFCTSTTLLLEEYVQFCNDIFC